MKDKSFFIKSYGCQMNEYDSEKISSLLLKDGYSNISDINKADLIVFNTCNIREKAAQKVYSDIGRVTKKNNNKTIALVGCVAQAENDEIFKKNKDVDIVLGPQSYHLLPKMIDTHNEYQKKQINTDFIINEKFDFVHEEKSPKGVSSYLTIQEGCDKFCAFCVVPFTRGPEYSRSVNNIVEETKSLIDRGTREIILLGQNVNAYNYNDEKNITYNISKLIDEISQLEGVKRIRYTTSHPNNMDQELIRLHGSNEKLMPFLHLPVQSGSNEILKNMNRKYSVDEYKKIIDDLKKVRREIAYFYDDLDINLTPLGFVKETFMQDSFPIWKSKENSIIIQGICLAEFKRLDPGKMIGFQQEIINFRMDGFSAFRIWEDVWNQKKPWILNFLTFRINKPISIFARDTKVVILEEKDVRDFANKNH